MEIVYFLAKSNEDKITLSKEHDSYMWATREKALELVRDETKVVLLKTWKKIVGIEKLSNY